MTGIRTTTLLGVALVLLIIGALLLSLSANAERQRIASITNFEECAAAGYPIMESYPERCALPDGRTFVNESQAAPGAPMTFNGCAVAGCSGQVCVSADEAGNIVTTCEFRAEYACYREASCEPQADGKCGWTQTQELKKCLADPPALDAEIVPAL